MSIRMETIENVPRINCLVYRPRFSSTCKIAGDQMWGEILIEYYPGGALLELISVNEFIDTLKTQSVTVEEVARIVFDECKRVLGDIRLRVCVDAETTGHAPVSAEIYKKGFYS